ncbi:hypothetical protein [Chryseobacterium sp. POL2]|uniref:hypothetical protein n=1 Tax=Chryseobacterium sp. POL2 TaxID=2713414 RepID=UPI0013E10F18|nr:hypothetical protein [Chryseobacterium sp. POL2]QIG88711.1 hypothetical protein G6R40_03060 [Chryseobacterium sp. POL2]
MKKLFLLAALGGLSMMNAQKFEISAGYGTSSLFGVADSILKGIGEVAGKAIFGGDDVVLPNSKGVFTIAGTVYSQDMKWRYGLEANVETFSENGTSYKEQSYFSVLPKVDYFWSDADSKWRFYSGASVGALFRNVEYVDFNSKVQKANDTFLAFNIMPIGVRYGGSFGVFLEPSIGTRGLVQAGFSYAF